MFTDLPLDELHTYRPPRPEPAGFDAFWRRTLDEARAHDLDARERVLLVSDLDNLPGDGQAHGLSLRSRCTLLPVIESARVMARPRQAACGGATS